MGQQYQEDPKRIREIMMAWRRAGLEPPPEHIGDFVDIYTRTHQSLQRLQEMMRFDLQPAVAYGFPATFVHSGDHDE